MTVLSQSIPLMVGAAISKSYLVISSFLNSEMTSRYRDISFGLKYFCDRLYVVCKYKFEWMSQKGKKHKIEYLMSKMGLHKWRNMCQQKFCLHGVPGLSLSVAELWGVGRGTDVTQNQLLPRPTARIMGQLFYYHLDWRSLVTKPSEMVEPQVIKTHLQEFKHHLKTV